MFLFDRPMTPILAGLVVAAAGVAMNTMHGMPSSADPLAGDAAQLAAIDTAYQAAVERNDAAAMARVLHPCFTLRLGDGRRLARDDLLAEARRGDIVYQRQVEVPGTQQVLVQGDVAIVTALLWSKGERAGTPFEYRLWFSDTYVRTRDGWKYLFGQASLPLVAKATVASS